MNERVVDLLLAAALAALPLLPTGAQYLGLSTASWAEAILVVLAAILLVTPRRGPLRSSTAGTSFAAGWVIAPFIVAVTGGALIGLASNNVVASAAFLANLREAPLRVFAPMDQVVDPLYPLRTWLTFLEGPMAFVLVAAICRRASEPGRRARAALGGAVTGLALVSAFAIFQYVARFDLHPHWAQADPGLVRSHSTFEDPNTLGSYLVLGLGLAAALLLRERTVRPAGWRLRLTAAVVVLVAAALVASVSRAALGAAFISALLLTAYGPSWRPVATPADWAPVLRRVARRVVAVTGVLFVLWVVARVWLPEHADYHPESPLEAVFETVDPRVPLAQVLKGRHLLWAAALDMARAHPIAGIGLGRYPRILGSERGFPIRVENTHNFFLQLLAEIGAAGLCTFLLIVAMSAWALRRAARAGGANVGLVWGLSFGLLAFTLTLVAGHPLLLPSVQLVVGTTLAAGLMATFAPPTGSRPRPRPRVVVPAVIATLALVYGTAAARTSWQRLGDQYGYTWGFFGLEHDEAWHYFRWMGRDALLYVVPPDNTAELYLDIAAFAPGDDTPTTMTIEAAGRRFSVTRHDGAWQRVTVPVARAVSTARGLEIRFHVDRTIVPATLGGSDDRRELGAMLRPPTFAAGPGRQ